MGFFSWECKGCGHSILSNYSSGNKNNWMSKAVAIKKDGKTLIGEYDGYGRVNGKEVTDGKDFDASMYHKACWELLGRPKKYKISKSANDQGFFFDKKDHDVPDPSIIMTTPLEDLPTLLGKNPVWDKYIEARLKKGV